LGEENCTFSSFGEGNCISAPGKKIVPIRISYTPVNRKEVNDKVKRFVKNTIQLQISSSPTSPIYRPFGSEDFPKTPKPHSKKIDESATTFSENIPQSEATTSPTLLLHK
jgi:hypothetical protein